MTADIRKVDLHLHSLESDGRLTPTELVELAARNGVGRMALTDHDTTSGVAEAIAAGRRLGVEVIPGIELSADAQGGDVHMLGLFLEYEDAEFQRQVAWLREGRVGRAMQMVERLAELGAPIAWERVKQLAGEASVGRPHVAQALLEAGHVRTIPEAFDRFLRNGGPAYVERERFDAAASVALLHAVGGLAVLAHPIVPDRSVEGLIPELVAAGLDGVECYYQGYGAETVERLVSQTRAHGLVPTGGSDYHGFPMSGMTAATNEPGSVYVPAEIVDELLERRGRRFG
jgi:3',5'-nucleoside bisphosphate phosphatase